MFGVLRLWYLREIFFFLQLDEAGGCQSGTVSQPPPPPSKESVLSNEEVKNVHGHVPPPPSKQYSPAEIGVARLKEEEGPDSSTGSGMRLRTSTRFSDHRVSMDLGVPNHDHPSGSPSYLVRGTPRAEAGDDGCTTHNTSRDIPAWVPTGRAMPVPSPSSSGLVHADEFLQRIIPTTTSCSSVGHNDNNRSGLQVHQGQSQNGPAESEVTQTHVVVAVESQQHHHQLANSSGGAAGSGLTKRTPYPSPQASPIFDNSLWLHVNDASVPGESPPLFFLWESEGTVTSDSTCW